MWMVHAVIINEIWHSGVLLLICYKKRIFIGQNKWTVVILHPVFRILRAIRSFISCQWKPTANVSCQLDFQRFVSRQLTPSRPSNKYCLLSYLIFDRKKKKTFMCCFQNELMNYWLISDTMTLSFSFTSQTRDYAVWNIYCQPQSMPEWCHQV